MGNTNVREVVDVEAEVAKLASYSFYCTGTTTIVGSVFDQFGDTIGVFVTNGNLIATYNFTFTSIMNGTDATMIWSTSAAPGAPNRTYGALALSGGSSTTEIAVGQQLAVGIDFQITTTPVVNWTTGALKGSAMLASANSPAIGLDFKAGRVGL